MADNFFNDTPTVRESLEGWEDTERRRIARLEMHVTELRDEILAERESIKRAIRRIDDIKSALAADWPIVEHRTPSGPPRDLNPDFLRRQKN